MVSLGLPYSHITNRQGSKSLISGVPCLDWREAFQRAGPRLSDGGSLFSGLLFFWRYVPLCASKSLCLSRPVKTPAGGTHTLTAGYALLSPSLASIFRKESTFVIYECTGLAESFVQETRVNLSANSINPLRISLPGASAPAGSLPTGGQDHEG